MSDNAELIVPTEENPLYTVGTVAKLFDVNQAQIRVWIKEGKIKAIKVLGHWRIQKSEVVRLANEEYGRGSTSL